MINEDTDNDDNKKSTTMEETDQEKIISNNNNNDSLIDDDNNNSSINSNTSISIEDSALNNILTGVGKTRSSKKKNKKTREISRPSIVTQTSIACLTNPSLRENLSSLPKCTPKGFKPDKRYYCAHELYTTERDYVDILEMLTEDFKNAVQPYVDNKWLYDFFRPLNSVIPINKELLQELQKRILKDWDDNPKISGLKILIFIKQTFNFIFFCVLDIIIEVCPYFKEYSIYIRQINLLNTMLDYAVKNFNNFETILRTFENSDRCRKLSIKSYLVKPIQRLPQYRLMLLEYLKQLQPDEQEYQGTQKALKVVSEVVEHLDRESMLVEQSLILNELRNRIILNKPTKIVIPGRILIRRGQLEKVSRKEVHVRYFILVL